ncbi:MAG TPA: prepilin-type N-terminal cleavage/methylation domain-containing protein [Burkholderiaceae bacterium]|nr:prepilin-type N-terminal cleavage/methylation domain-containing protein [Burkholderiaceae bacterium]
MRQNPAHAVPSPPIHRRAFTLIELLVVLAIVALLLTIAAPRYIQHVERARETALRSSLKVMRDAIDKFQGDQGRWPQNLDELVARSYLKAIPVDPITEKRDTWMALSESDLLAMAANSPGAPTNSAVASANVPVQSGAGMADIRSGASGNGTDGTPYQQW